jgi:uncharacterized membrane protein YdjX (TVP38/TMEM64 family)
MPLALPCSARLRAILTSPPIVVALALGLAFGIAALVEPGTWDALRALAHGDRQTLRHWLDNLGALAPLASVGLNVAQAVVAPIPGFIVPYVNGATFGMWPGALVTWIGGIAGAMACFGLSRTVARRLATRYCRRSRRLEAASRRLERHGGLATFLIRLLPGSPFDFVSYLAGLTRIRPWSFLWGTALGSAPHAMAYAWLGSSLDVPIWIGVALTPVLGLAYVAAVATARSLVRLAQARA